MMPDAFATRSSDPAFFAPTRLVVMGVSGCGKSRLAEALGARLGWPMIEGDAFHSARNIARMQAGIALTDADRADWLDALGRVLARHADGAVLSCSALKRAYRDRLRAAAPGLGFVHLDISRELALQRVQARAGEHFFHPGLVDSQFAALEPPVGEDGVLRLDATQATPEACSDVIRWMRLSSSS